MTFDPGTRVSHRRRPHRVGAARVWRHNDDIPHRTLVRWDDGYEQFVDDVDLVTVDAEQETLAL